MPKFDEVTGEQFLKEYNGKELFKEFIPVIGKMPSIAYVPFHKKQVMRSSRSSTLCTATSN